jgi:PAS domain S-box-containing protein
MNQFGDSARQVITNIADGYYALDSEWRFVDLDHLAEEHFGRCASELLGRNIWSETGTTPDSPVYAKFHEAAAGKQRMRFELESLARASQRSEFSLHPRPGGGLDVFFRDVTERRRSEDSLRESEERFRELTEASFEGLVIHADGVLLDVNSRITEMLGYRPVDLIGQRFWTFIAPEYHEEVREQLARRATLPYEVDLIHLDGRRVPVEVLARPITWRRQQVRAAALRDVSERRRAEEALRESEERLSLALAATNDAVWDINLRAGTVHWNETYARRFGRPPESASSWQWWIDRIHAEDRERAAKGLRDAVDGAAPSWSCEYRFLRADGTWADIFDRAFIARDETGKAWRVVGAMMDVTDQKQAEEALRKVTRRFQTILDHAPVAIYAKNRNGQFTFGNRRLEQLTGRRLEELIGKTDYDFAPRENADRWRENDLKVLDGEGMSEFEEAGTDAAGRDYVNLSIKFPVRDDWGMAAEVCGISTDITDRKRAEAELAQSRKRYQALIETTSDFVWETDACGRYTYCSPQMRELWGINPEEMLGKTPFDMMPPEQKASAEQGYAELAKCPKPFSAFVSTAFDAAGRLVDIEASGVPFFGSGGEFLGFRGISRDITARKRTEEALRESERRERDRAAELQTILDTAPIGLAIATDPDGQHIQGNRANEEMFGLSRGAELSKVGPHAAQFRPIQGGRELPVTELPMQRAIRGEVVGEQVFDVVREDGEVLTVFAKAAPLFDEAGRPRGAVGAFLDISALKRAEDALREADRRKDEFIAVLSHELRNPLAPIRYALPLVHAQPLNDTAGRAVAVIKRQTDRLARLLDDLLDVGRIASGKLELRREQVTLRSVVTEAMEAATPALSAAHHILNLNITPERVWLNADPARVGQVLTNLLDNSAKFTPSGGEITLEATREGDQAVIRVRDQGQGVPPDALPHIFEMFRQAASPGHSGGGMGIGLAIAKRLVEMHEGTIEAFSAGLGKGAEFVVRLPVAHQGTTAERAPLSSTGTSGRRLKVLVVDDNLDLVEMLALVVEDAGHEVRKAFDGPEAISTARACRPDVVLLDLGLPSMSGIDVARELRCDSATSDARLIALTGWGQAEDREKTRAAGFHYHLTKPTEPEELRQLLQAIAAGVA